MLDLAGFESLAFNGLEQLCINSANERLQALCDACVLDREQQVPGFVAHGINERVNVVCTAITYLTVDHGVNECVNVLCTAMTCLTADLCTAITYLTADL